MSGVELEEVKENEIIEREIQIKENEKNNQNEELNQDSTTQKYGTWLWLLEAFIAHTLWGGII